VSLRYWVDPVQGGPGWLLSWDRRAVFALVGSPRRVLELDHLRAAVRRLRRGGYVRSM